MGSQKGQLAGQYHRNCDAEGNTQGTNKACSGLAMSGHTDGGGVRIEHAATREKTVGLNGTAQQPQYMHCNQAGQPYRLEEGRVEGPRRRQITIQPSRGNFGTLEPLRPTWTWHGHARCSRVRPVNTSARCLPGPHITVVIITVTVITTTATKERCHTYNGLAYNGYQCTTQKHTYAKWSNCNLGRDTTR